MFFSSVLPFLSLAKARAMILLHLSIFLTGLEPFFLTAGCHSQRWLSWWSKDHLSQHVQLARGSGSFVRTQGVAGSAAEVALHQWAQHQLHCCKSSRKIGRPGLSCVKPSFLQENLQECCPRDWRHVFTLTQLHLSDATGTRGLAGLPTLIFFPWYLLASSFLGKPRVCCF